MNRGGFRRVAVLVALSPLAMSSGAHGQQNGEARSAVPTVVREDYDMRAFVTPLRLTETEQNGRRLFAQRCANCHGGTAARPGPLLGPQTVERRGEASIRDHVRKGSPVMPGFEYTLASAQIDQIIAFLKVAPPPRSQPASPD